MFDFHGSRLESVMKKTMCMMVLLATLGSLVHADKKNVLMILVNDLKPEFGIYGADYVV